MIECNIRNFRIFLIHCIYDYSPNGVKWLVYVILMYYIFCEVRTEFFCERQTSTCSPTNNDFKTSAHIPKFSPLLHTPPRSTSHHPTPPVPWLASQTGTAQWAQRVATGWKSRASDPSRITWISVSATRPDRLWGPTGGNRAAGAWSWSFTYNYSSG
jgi:hypothetical protein